MKQSQCILRELKATTFANRPRYQPPITVLSKMRYGRSERRADRSTIIVNEHLTVSGIPIEAYDYVINGKPAIDWVVERQGVRTDKASGIVNDANDWAIETMKNPRYPLELLLRVVTVSVETMKVVNSLPELHVEDSSSAAATLQKDAWSLN